MKECRICKEYKPLSSFHKNKLGKLGVRNECKECRCQKDRKKFDEIISFPNEIWEDIIGYEGVYSVSNKGRVKSLERYYLSSDGRKVFLSERLLSVSITRQYEKTYLFDKTGKKTYSTHRLVAQAFIPNPENKPQVNHINGIKTDNRVENLEWCTPAENVQHAFRTGLLPQMPRGKEHYNVKLTIEQVKEIKREIKEKYFTQKKLAEKYNVSTSLISHIATNRLWKNII